MQEANLSIDSPFFFLFCLAFNFTNFWSLSDHFEGSFLPQIRTTLSLQHNFFLWFFWKTTQLALFATCSHFRSNLDAPSEPFGKFFEQFFKRNTLQFRPEPKGGCKMWFEAFESRYRQLCLGLNERLNKSFLRQPTVGPDKGWDW